ncbi:MAG: Asp-tRNA(Asn)/Glu-tRNA(Gln) amidotransferase subunit GatB [Bacteroidetes bacterium]|nr:Asp-tRNA(Asn)/Glu-tRNA(Gln) amidotransferase subunit GatB [Bacteroidota bacterium]
MVGSEDKYEVVIGLEVHAQLATKTKIFAPEDTTFGASPNTQVSSITMALPGTLPKLNSEVVHKAVIMGLACHCKITELSRFARKNYFYPDLPKGYQVSQDKTPICVGGYVEIDTPNGIKQVQLNRIHMEEDAGKNNHEIDPNYSLVDLNRAGVPLIEIVSEPDLCNSDEASTMLTEVRKLVRYLEICDGNMEEGSMRCDANISIRLKGEKELGTKVEIKNMNSIRNVKRAIDKEVTRQIQMMEAGEKIVQQTRSFNPEDGSSFPLRSKEYAHDYRYFPEPDLPPVITKKEDIDKLRSEMPPLPRELYHFFTGDLKLSDYDAKVLTDKKGIALFFCDLIKKTTNTKSAANWVMGPVKSYLNEHAVSVENFPVTTEQLAGIIALVDESKLSLGAAKKVFTALRESTGANPLDLAIQMNLIQDSDEDQLGEWVQQAINLYPDKVKEYRKGKKGLLGMFMGEVMKVSKGKADPKKTSTILREVLDN